MKNLILFLLLALAAVVAYVIFQEEKTNQENERLQKSFDKLMRDNRGSLGPSKTTSEILAQQHAESVAIDANRANEAERLAADEKRAAAVAVAAKYAAEKPLRDAAEKRAEAERIAKKYAPK